MIIVLSHARTGAFLPALLTLAAMFWSCASGPPGTRSPALDGAVESYISGDYDRAVAQLEKLAEETATQEVLREVYLYLGRAYVAQGRYSRAIDAFTAGKAQGGGPVFDEYLRRLGVLVAGDPDAVAMAARLDRGQVAALIERMFYGTPDDLVGSGANGAVVLQLEAVRRGVVPVLPDGEFHGEAPVTRASFYAIVARLLAERGVGVPVEVFFEGGYRWALAAEPGVSGNGRYVSGREALATLESVLQVVEANGG